ncbi:MAG: restriction endonuclease subunit S, partial [Rhodocyclaceae bacterium]|nr:restriction endonuclease subunit S [Rhodocyclaceae bacterium]
GGVMASWTKTSLGKACSIVRGGSPRPIQAFLTSDAGGINWVKISDATASGKYIFGTVEKIKPEGASRSRLVRDGDFLLSNSMSFGRPYIMRTTGCVHDGWLVLSNYQGAFEQDFLYYLLSSPQVFKQFDQLAAGSTVRNLNIDLASRVVVPVPPLDEQRRIVAILDEAFEAIATAKANTEKNLQNAQDAFESYLAQVFMARHPASVERVLSSLCARITVGHVGSMADRYKPTGIPFLRSQNIRPFSVTLDNLVYIDEDFHSSLSKSSLHAGDVAIVRTGYPGTAAVIPESLGTANCSDLVIVKPGPEVDAHYLAAFFNSAFGKGTVGGKLVGAAQKHFNVGAAKDVVLHLPPLQEQRAIVAAAMNIRKEAERLANVLGRKLAALDELKQSLLHQAFSGQLTARQADRTVAAAV